MLKAVSLLFTGLTDEEVELAIQRSGSTEEVLALSPVGPPHLLHAPLQAPVPQGEYTLSRSILMGATCTVNNLSIYSIHIVRLRESAGKRKKTYHFS